MIHVITPFKRKENIELLSNVLKGKANWIVLVDDETLVFPDWVTVKKYSKPPEGICPSNWLFNEFISGGLEAETQYMILCDDDSVEDGFFDKIPNADVVVTSMKRGDKVPLGSYGTGTLFAKPENMHITGVGGEQVIVKGKILRNFRYGLSNIGDGEMIMRLKEEHEFTYVPDAYVLFNYFQDERYNSFRRKPIVLFVGDYWCAGNPGMGLSEWEGNIWASLESTELVNVGRFHFDKYYYHYGKRGDSALVEAIDNIKPDYIVAIIYKPLGSDPCVMVQSTLEVIKMMGVPLITIWGDLEDQHQRDISKTVAPYCVKVIGTANKQIVEEMGYTYMHVPKDPRVFNNPDKKRDLDIVFSGSYGLGRSERQKTLQNLLDNGIQLIAGGSEGGDHFPTEEYANRYKRAKLGLSFSRARGVNVVNARPFEVMLTGALLMEQESPELAKLYTPGVDYIEWTSHVDLLDKVRYYLEHDEERKKIAESGQRKTEQLYSALNFWKSVLGKK